MFLSQIDLISILPRFTPGYSMNYSNALKPYSPIRSAFDEPRTTHDGAFAMPTALLNSAIMAGLFE